MRVFILFGIFSAVRAQCCGKTSFPQTPNKLSYNIVGGETCREGDFPWQVGIFNSEGFLCGGMYVTGVDDEPRVISAAHCFDDSTNPGDYVVAFGMHHTNVIGNRKEVLPAKLVLHPDYISQNFSNDIAVLSFDNTGIADINQQAWARPVCLPSRPYNHGENVLVSGWGFSSEGGSDSDTLKYVWKSILSLENCEKTENAGLLDSTMLCATKAGKDSCQGDSGGPLVAVRNGVWEAVGVVSWGIGCGLDNFPGVYADIFALREWVYSNI